MENNKIDVEYLRKEFEIIDEYKNNKKIYYFKCDANDKNTLIEKGFELTVLPHQWWGNIVNPKVVILAINPHYGAGEDELDSMVFEDLIKNNHILVNDCGQFLFDDSKGKCDIPFIYSSVSRWWMKVFKGIIPDVLEKNLSAKDKEILKLFNENIGIFNLVGYQSVNANNIPKIECKSEENVLNYVNQLASEKNSGRIFIFVWGRDKWIDAFSRYGLECNITKYIEVNRNDSINKNINTQNKKLSIKVNETHEEDRNTLKNILTGSATNEEIEDFIKKYKTQ